MGKIKYPGSVKYHVPISLMPDVIAYSKKLQAKHPNYSDERLARKVAARFNLKTSKDVTD